jgi:hypothetical protein
MALIKANSFEMFGGIGALLGLGTALVYPLLSMLLQIIHILHNEPKVWVLSVFGVIWAMQQEHC